MTKLADRGTLKRLGLSLLVSVFTFFGGMLLLVRFFP